MIGEECKTGLNFGLRTNSADPTYIAYEGGYRVIRNAVNGVRDKDDRMNCGRSKTAEIGHPVFLALAAYGNGWTA
jgi:hypothetical protein